MQIDLNNNPAMKDALLQRLKLELAETCSVSFVLDMMVGQLVQENQDLQRKNEELIQSNTRLVEDNKTMRADLEKMVRPERAERTLRKVS